jgi:hypothetical protein
MIKWLLRCVHFRPVDLRHAVIGRSKGNLLRTADVRYTIAKILHSDIVQRAFDLVIIDCPPRLTTAKIQALCAGSRLLFPPSLTALPPKQSSGCTSKSKHCDASGFCPHMKSMGVVGTM